MSTSQTKPVSRKELKKFGLVVGGVFMIVFGLLFPYFGEKASPVWPWAIGIFLWAGALIAPQLLYWIYTAWMKVGGILGVINTRVILGFVFYGVIVPIATAFRILKKDPLRLVSDPSSASYRINREKLIQPACMEKPF